MGGGSEDGGSRIEGGGSARMANRGSRMEKGVGKIGISDLCRARAEAGFGEIDPLLAKAKQEEHDFDMATVTIALPDPLDAALRKRMAGVRGEGVGANSGGSPGGGIRAVGNELERTRAPIRDEIAVRLDRHPAVITE